MKSIERCPLGPVYEIVKCPPLRTISDQFMYIRPPMPVGAVYLNQLLCHSSIRPF